MLITAIEVQKKNKQRYSVFIEGKFAFGLTGTDVLYYKLKEGAELTNAQYEQIIADTIYQEAKNRALKYLSYQARTEKEIFKKLQSLEYPEEVIWSVLTFLKEYHYVDDVLYTENYITYCFSQKGQGAYKIKYDLMQKGVAENIVTEFLDQYEVDTESIMIKLIEKKFKKFDIFNEKEKQKVYNYLSRRGFSYDEVMSVLRKYFKGDAY